MSINADIELKDGEDTKSAENRLRKALSREGYRAAPHCFVKPSAKRYRHIKKLKHLATLKLVKDSRYHSKYRQPRPITDDTTGKQYRAYLWRKFSTGCTFRDSPKNPKRSPWQDKHNVPVWHPVGE